MRKYLLTFKLGIVNTLNYRGNLIAGFGVYSIFILTFFYLWSAVYSNGDLGGLTLTQTIWYLCITEIISFGANTRVFNLVSEDVKSGAIAYHLLRPYGYIGYRYASAMGPAVMNTMLFAIMGAILGFITVGGIPGFQLWVLPVGFVMVILGVSLNFLVQMAIGLMSFWVEECSGFNLILSKCIFMFGTFLPIEFLPDWLRVIVEKLPFSYVSWAPARLIVGFEWGLFTEAICMQIIYLAVFAVICAVLMHFGRRAVQTNGG